MRYVNAAVFFAVAVAAGLFAYGALQNLWGDGDSPTSTYLLVGLPWLALSLLAALAGIRVVRRR